MNQKFLDTLWSYYEVSQRDLPWRIPEKDGSFDEYKILVSEVMLQQTQVPRATLKYQEFLHVFPTIHDLADAKLADVLRTWQGLGYNRRAKYLHEAAKFLVSAQRPWRTDELVSLSGIGPNTAAAICVYSYNLPLTFVETNIRTIMLHHFFQNQTDIKDEAIARKLTILIKNQNPRTFYWACMDYGSYLKKKHPKINQRSAHFAKQSKFAGSSREIRGKVIRLLSTKNHSTKYLQSHIPDTRLPLILDRLESEGLICKVKSTYQLSL